MWNMMAKTPPPGIQKMRPATGVGGMEKGAMLNAMPAGIQKMLPATGVGGMEKGPMIGALQASPIMQQEQGIAPIIQQEQGIAPLMRSRPNIPMASWNNMLPKGMKK